MYVCVFTSISPHRPIVELAYELKNEQYKEMHKCFWENDYNITIVIEIVDVVRALHFGECSC